MLELAVLGAVWWILKLDLPLVGAIAGVIVVGGIVPERFSSLATGLGMLGVAALVYFHYGHQPLALVLALFGAINLVSGINKLR